MATEFVELWENCKDIYLKVDAKNRRAKIDKWCKQAIKELQAGIPGEIEKLIQEVESNIIDEAGFLKEAAKSSWHNRIDGLVLELRIKPGISHIEDTLPEPKKLNDSWFKRLLAKLRLR